MPQLSPADRQRGAGPPAKRNQWRCPTCGARGWGQNAHAAMTAGLRHYTDEHDNETPRTDVTT